MKPGRNFGTLKALICLLSVFLITAGVSRYIETDSGNILIHDIEVESFDCYLYQARLFRPIQASSMNRRPGVLLFPGADGNRYTGDHIAMELARRGFVALTIESTPFDTSGPVSDQNPESPVDSGYTFLTTRFFTNPERTGLVTFLSGSDQASAAEHLNDFTSRVFISGNGNVDNKTSFSDEEHTTAISSSKIAIMLDASVISSILEQFHRDLAIPNDSPFWFSADAQRAQLLVTLRFLLLPLLFIICCVMSYLIADGKRYRILRALSGVMLPFLFFAFNCDFMNHFLISVRMGLPFHYISSFSKIVPSISPVMLALFILCFAFFTILFNKIKKQVRNTSEPQASQASISQIPISATDPAQISIAATAGSILYIILCDLHHAGIL